MRLAQARPAAAPGSKRVAVTAGACSRRALLAACADTPPTSWKPHAAPDIAPFSSRRDLLVSSMAVLPLLHSRAQPAAAAAAATAGSPELDPSFFADYPYAQPSDILPYVYATASRGDANAVLDAVDTFSQYYPMYKIGPEKGALLEQQLQQYGQIYTALEIGTFLGYSAIRTARHLAPGGLLVCIEANSDNAAVARQLLDYSGMGGSVTILQGLGSQQLPVAAQLLAKARADLSSGSSNSTATNNPDGSSSSIATPALADFLFLDHCKDCYLPDLQQAEQLQVVGPGTLVMADNVLYPGAPGFLEYLDSSGRYQTQLLRAKYEYEQLWNPNWEPGKEDALSASVAGGQLGGSGAAVGGGWVAGGEPGVAVGVVEC